MFRRCLMPLCLLATLTPIGVAQDGERPAKSLTNSLGMKLVRIPAGEFRMGSADDDPGGREDERPRHRVRITKPFYLGVYEVTQAEFESVMKINPSTFTRKALLHDAPPEIDAAKLPVDGVTWHQAVEFCRKISEMKSEQAAGRFYRLPTEAEWEYACRAGTTTTFHFGDALSSTQANFNGAHPYGEAKSGPFLKRTHTVGSYPPNAFGLYDMHGNLHEWCLDRFGRDYYQNSPADDPRGPDKGSRRVIRGGDWYSDARDCRSAFRYADVPAGKFYALGMRVVCELKSEGATLDPIIAKAGEPDADRGFPMGGISGSDDPQPSSGEDWPRWRGVRGDGAWNSPKLPLEWPEGVVPLAWRQELGGGYGGIAVSGGRVYVMDRQREPNDVERLLCIDGVTGEMLWSHEWPVDYSGVSYDNGPRSTPNVVQGRVYVMGAVGHLFCCDAANGQVVWSKNLVSECNAKVPIWGLSASPVVFCSLVIVHCGAEPNGSLMAFDVETGAERWRNFADGAGYATPILIERAGKPQLVAWTPTHVRSVDPATGQELWSTPFEVQYGTSIAEPLYRGGIVLVTSYYEGSLAIRVPTGDEKARIVWKDNRNLRGLMSPPMFRDGRGYLIDKRHGLTCFEWATGKKLWDDDNRLTPKGRNPQATLVWINDEDRAIALNSDGELVLLRLNADGYAEQSRAKIIGETWAHPAYAGNCVYARSDTEIVCVVLPTKK